MDFDKLDDKLLNATLACLRHVGEKGHVSLEYLIEQYDFVLFDTNTLIQSFSSSARGDKDINVRFKEQNKFNCFLKELVYNKEANIYLTPFILEEYKKPASLFPRELSDGLQFIKRVSPRSFSKAYKRRNLSFNKKIRKAGRKMDCFAEVFIENNRVLELNDVEVVLRDYFYDRLNKMSSSVKLNEEDKDLVASGIVISQTRGRTAIISNDLPLRRSLNYLIKKEFGSIPRCDHYLRQGFNSYEKSKKID